VPETLASGPLIGYHPLREMGSFTQHLSWRHWEKAAVAKKMSVKPTKGESTADSKPRRQRVLSNDQIGDVAGEVWELLSGKNEQTLAAIKKSVDAPADVVVAAVGWLAREDKLDFRVSGRSVKVSLR
jgi:hypothetical protein